MHTPVGGLPRSAGRLEGGQREPGVDRATDGPAHNAARPAVDHERDVDEAAHAGDVCEVGDPELVGTVGLHSSSEIGKHRKVVSAVRSDDEASAAPGLQAVFPHQPSHLLGVDHDPLVPERRADTAIAVGFELVADRPDPGDDLGVVRQHGRRVIVDGTRQAHQFTSLGDGHAEGPVMANVGPFLGRALFSCVPFKKSISSA